MKPHGIQGITDHERSDEESFRPTELAEQLIASANAMIVVLDTQSRILVFNQSAEDITGYTRQEVSGCNWFKLTVPDDRYRCTWKSFLQFARKGLVRTFEKAILTKTGEERVISFRVTGLLQDGIFSGAIIYGIDITRRTQLEKQLLQSQKMEAIGQLAGGIAHDFNNMLSVILWQAELMKFALPGVHPLHRKILEIEKAGLHSQNIIRQLLNFSGKQVMVPQTINLNRLIADTIRTLAPLIGKNINLRFIPASRLWNIKFYPSQVDQILINLAVNARDAMPHGGTLTIETSNVQFHKADRALPGECKPGGYVLLAVSDNGVGMDREMLAHIFEPLFTTKAPGKGTGLGLSTVYGIIKQSSGFINVSSEPQKGSSFRIYLPRIANKVKTQKKTGKILDYQLKDRRCNLEGGP